MSIGTDFERFLLDGDAAKSAAFLGLPDKFEPHVPLNDDGGLAGYIHRDNLMIELCVAPQDTGDGLQAAVTRVLEATKTWLATVAPSVSISPYAQAEFAGCDLHSDAGKELGCDVDFVARDMNSAQREPMNARMLGRFRFAGGHLHFSWPREDIPAWVGAGLCDLFIGLPESEFLNPIRANFYGAGSLHRPTTYPDGSRGVEYRPLDCYWTTNNQDLERVSRRADAVHKLLNEGRVEMIRRLVDLWLPLNTPQGVLQQLGNLPQCREAAQRATEEFRKEFGYDPV